MNSGEVLEQPHEGVGVLQHARRNHLGGEFVAEQEDRQPVVAAALGGQHLFEHLPSRVGLSSAPSTETSQQDSLLKTLTSRRASS